MGIEKLLRIFLYRFRKEKCLDYFGPNGAGKTTTIECVLGIKKSESEQISILGYHPKKDRKKLFQKVGVQFQQSNYQEKIKVKEICSLTSAFYENSKDWKELITIFGLQERQNNLINELSGGEKQKLSVLLALIPNPEIVFLDELTTGLDPKSRREIWNYLQSLKERGLTIILTSHYMDEVENLCDQICLIKNCQVLAKGSVQEVIRKSPYTTLEKAYLWYLGEEEVINESF